MLGELYHSISDLASVCAAMVAKQPRQAKRTSLYHFAFSRPVEQCSCVWLMSVEAQNQKQFRVNFVCALTVLLTGRFCASSLLLPNAWGSNKIFCLLVLLLSWCLCRLCVLSLKLDLLYECITIVCSEQSVDCNVRNLSHFDAISHLNLTHTPKYSGQPVIKSFKARRTDASRVRARTAIKDTEIVRRLRAYTSLLENKRSL